MNIGLHLILRNYYYNYIMITLSADRLMCFVINKTLRAIFLI